MKRSDLRTDLAVELNEVLKLSEKDGIRTEEVSKNGISVTRMSILTPDAAEKVGKAQGRYITVDLSGAFTDTDTHTSAVEATAEEISALLYKRGDEGTARADSLSKAVLVVGLGNAGLSSDSIGPKTVETLLVTRHIKEFMPELYGSLKLSNVSAIVPGVVGQTGIETADIIKAAIEKTRPDAVLVIDALASRMLNRLCRTIQITDTGITPGSGVGNDREELSEKTLGLPVTAIGIPTVVDSFTLAADIIRSAADKLTEKLSGFSEDGSMSKERLEELLDGGSNMIVTPKDIDRSILKCSRLLGLALNKALHYGLSQEEINALLDI